MIADELAQLEAEHRMLKKKLAERRLLMERVWEEKRDEDETIRRLEREAIEADISGYERTIEAKKILAEQQRQDEEEEARRRVKAPPPLIDDSPRKQKMAKIRALEAKKGLVY